MIQASSEIYPNIRGYTRCSDGRQETEGVPSIQTQAGELRGKAETIPHGRYYHYEDEGRSAWKLPAAKRIGLQKLITDSERGDLVMVWTLNRLSRRPLELTEILSILNRRGVAVLAVAQFDGKPLLMDTVSGVIWIAAIEIANALWTDEMRRTTARGKEYNRRNGLFNGGPRPPIGRKVVSKRARGGRTVKAVVWDEQQLKYIRELDGRVQQGEPLLRVCRDFIFRDLRAADGKPLVKVIHTNRPRRGKPNSCGYTINGYVYSALKLMEHTRAAGVADPQFLHPTMLEPIQADTDEGAC